MSESVEAAATAQPIAARTAAGRKKASHRTRSVRPNGGTPAADVAPRQRASTQPPVGTPQSLDSAASIVRELGSDDGFVAAALLALTVGRPEMAPPRGTARRRKTPRSGNGADHSPGNGAARD